MVSYMGAKAPLKLQTINLIFTQSNRRLNNSTIIKAPYINIKFQFYNISTSFDSSFEIRALKPPSSPLETIFSSTGSLIGGSATCSIFLTSGTVS